MLAVRFRIRNTNGALTYLQRKRKPNSLRWPCHKDFRASNSAIFSHIYQKFGDCKGESVAAFRHKAGKGYLCARFVMEVLIDILNVPASPEVVGWCFRYKTRSDMRDGLEKKRMSGKGKMRHLRAWGLWPGLAAWFLRAMDRCGNLRLEQSTRTWQDDISIPALTVYSGVHAQLSLQ